MNIFHILRKDLKSVLNQIHVVLALFIGLPLILGLLYGVFYQGMLSAEVKVNPVSLVIENNDSGKQGEIFIADILSEIPEFIVVSDSIHKNGFTMILDESFSTDYTNGEIHVNLIDHGASSTGKYFFQSYLNSVVSKYNLSQTTVDTTPNITYVEKPYTVSSKTYMLLSVFIAISIFVAIHFASCFTKERESQVYKRLASFNITKTSIYYSSLTSVFIICITLCMLYYTLVLNVISKENYILSQIFMLSALQSFLITAFYGLMIGIFHKERTLKTYSIIFFFASSFFGGSFFPIEQFEGARRIAALTPNYNLFKLFQLTAEGTSITIHNTSVIALLVSSLILMLIGQVKFNIREV